MALVQCKDCGNEVSDSAAACPKCGAPVPKTLGTNEEKCPFCATVVAKAALVCPGCRAQKGYTQASGVIYGRIRTILFGVLLPAVLALIAFGFQNGFGTAIGAILGGVVAISCWRLVTGPVWYKARVVQ